MKLGILSSYKEHLSLHFYVYVYKVEVPDRFTTTTTNTIIIFFIIIINGSTTLCWALASYSNPYLFFTNDRTVWTSDQFVERPLPIQKTIQTPQNTGIQRHPCLELDWNSRSQCSSGRRGFMRGHCDWHLTD
jgi:hypothetical protein